jgi:CheY-like chemotaxis protein
LGGREGLELALDMPDDLPTVWADLDQLAQVIHNLLLNAAEAMNWVGCVRMSASTKDGADGRRVVISVEDQGPGVPAELRNRIFDPYFSTKGAGTGLGLATSYWIVRRHGGDLDITDRPEGGARFSLSLPALHVRVARSPASLEVELPCLKVLILDDESAVADGLRRLLVREGHTAVSVSTGSRVTPLWVSAQESGEPFDLAILDLVQPTGIGGLGALTQLHAADSTARTVVMSGYSEDPVMAEYCEYGFNSRLAKPFGPKRLKLALQQALKPSPRARVLSKG